jgi:adenosine deaminase/aminodeoxyfutalosine deaminase
MAQADSELHIHLEGSLEPELLCLLDTSLTLETARQLYNFGDFAGFIESFKAAVRRLQRPEHYAQAAAALFKRLHDEGRVYAEVILSAGVVLWKEQSLDETWAALREVTLAAPLRIRWIVDVVRQFGSEPALNVATWAARTAAPEIVAFGIGGDETSCPASDFAGAAAIAKEAGLHFVPHAGETSDAQNVWEMIHLGAERIGHGIRSASDPELLRYLRDHRIPLEVCPTSNVRTGAVASLDRHPLRILYDAGVPITLNSDDPAIFQTTLHGEFQAARGLGFTEDELANIAANARRYAFDFEGGLQRAR